MIKKFDNEVQFGGNCIIFFCVFCFYAVTSFYWGLINSILSFSDWFDLIGFELKNNMKTLVIYTTILLLFWGTTATSIITALIVPRTISSAIHIYVYSCLSYCLWLLVFNFIWPTLYCAHIAGVVSQTLYTLRGDLWVRFHAKNLIYLFLLAPLH